MSAVGVLRTYHSLNHLFAARFFASRAADAEQNEQQPHPHHRAFVTGSIMSSVAFLEAHVNELLQGSVDSSPNDLVGLPPGTIDTLSTYWCESGSREGIRTKYQACLRLTGAPTFPTGQEPFQGLSALLSLRNALVHAVPESANADTRQKLKDLLSQRFDEYPIFRNTGNPFYPDKCLWSACALWGVHTAFDFAQEFNRRLGRAHGDLLPSST